MTFTEAAEIARLSLWEFADLVKQRSIEWVRYLPEEVMKEFKKASAAKCQMKQLVFNSTLLIYLTKAGLSQVFEVCS